MNKVLSTTMVLLGAGIASMGIGEAHNGKKMEDIILKNNPQVSRVLFLEKALEPAELRGLNNSEILQKVFSDSLHQQVYRDIVTEYNKLISDPEIKSAVDAYKSNRNYGALDGAVFGLGLASAGTGVYGFLKRKK